MRLIGKTAMITGCNRGIGKAMAQKYASEGANLICAIRRENLEFKAETDVWAEKYGVKIDFVYFDLTDEDGIKAVFKELNKEKRIIDVLINNAGIPAGGFLLMTSLAKVKEVFQVNFFSQILVTQLVAKMMMKQKKGVIINMSSVTALDNQAGWTAYGSSKAAMASFTRTIARELAPFGIRANAIAQASSTHRWVARWMRNTRRRCWQELIWVEKVPLKKWQTLQPSWFLMKHHI